MTKRGFGSPHHSFGSGVAHEPPRANHTTDDVWHSMPRPVGSWGQGGRTDFADNGVDCHGQSVVITVQHTGEAASRRDPNESSMCEALRRLECDVPNALRSMQNAADEVVIALHGEYGVAEITGRKTRLEPLLEILRIAIE